MIKEGFVSISDRIPDVIIEARYYSTYNFIGKRFPKYDQPILICTEECASALKNVSDYLIRLGLRLRVYDAYRPQSTVDYFNEWVLTDNIKMKDAFYPNVNKTDFDKLHYLAKKSAHTRGSTVDVTIFDGNTGENLDMGSPFDFLDEKSNYAYKDLTDVQRRNREFLRSVMTNFGFTPIESEWWHFTLKNEPYPDTYFDFPIEY